MSQINVDTIRSREGIAPSLDKGVIVTGVATATEGYFSGNVTIGGTLTYEDVTNQDVIGLITARSGIKIGNDQDSTGIGITLGTGAIGDASFAGIVTAATCIKVGDGSFGVGIGATILGNGNAVFSGITTSSSFVGNLTGNVTGNASGTAGGLTGAPDVDLGNISAAGNTLTIGNITGVGITVSGICTVATGTNLNGYKVEEGAQDGSTSLNGEFDFELENGHIQRYSAATGGNYFPDFRVSSSQSVDSVMDVGDVISVTLIVASSSHYCTTGIKIDDSTSNLDIDWVGGAAPSAANGSGFDVYAFTIMKTATTPAYHIIGNTLGAA